MTRPADVEADVDGPEVWHLRLYVAGDSPRSMRAFANLQRICEEHLAGQYRIEILDVAANPELARTDDIVVLPTLVRSLPEPRRRSIGDLSDAERVLVGLRLGEVRPRVSS